MNRRLCGVVLVMMLVAWACPASASVVVENEMTTSFSSTNAGLGVYQYGTGVQKTADFATGTHTSTVESGGSLELDLAGTFADWWDVDFAHRQCFNVVSADAEVEYPIRFVVDTSISASTGADIRVVDASTNTLLTSYSEGPFPSTTSVVWAQAEPLPAGASSYCVYFDSPGAVSVSDEIATFTYTLRSVEHYTLSDRHFGVGVDSQVTVVSYANANVVSDGTTTVTLNAGQTATFSGLDQNSIITSTGPIDGSLDRDGRDTLVPEGYADAQFSFPTRRYVERFWIRSPHGNTTVEAVANGGVIASINVGPASGSVALNAPSPGNAPVSLRTTNGLDIIAMHIGTNRQDSMIGVPWSGDPLYGVASNNLNLTAFANTTVSWVRNDGASNGAQAITTSPMTVIGGNGAYGNGRAYAISGGTYFHAAQQADNDATETTSFLPERLLGQTYRTPFATRYFTIACPTPGTLVTISGGAPAVCAGTGVGLLYSGFGFQPAGTLIEADHPIFVYYEGLTHRNESNLLGAKSNIPYTTDVQIAPGVVEDLALCGSWESSVVSTAGVHGLAEVVASLPTDTTATLQISTDGSGFYGPDGTAGTSFADADIVPYLADGATTLQFRVELCTTNGAVTPAIDTFAVECDLVELVPDVSNLAAITINSPLIGTDEPLLRVYQRHPGAWTGFLEYRSGTGLSNSKASFFTDHPTTQTENGAGTITDPQTPFSNQIGEPYTVSVIHKTIGGTSSTMDIAVVGVDTRRTETGISVTFVN